MKLVIDIPENLYNFVNTKRPNGYYNNFDEFDCYDISKCIRSGISLPEGHGNLIDKDKLVYDCSLDFGGCDRICYCKGCSYHIIRETDINKAPIIIEANKGE